MDLQTLKELYGALNLTHQRVSVTIHLKGKIAGVLAKRQDLTLVRAHETRSKE